MTDVHVAVDIYLSILLNYLSTASCQFPFILSSNRMCSTNQPLNQLPHSVTHLILQCDQYNQNVDRLPSSLLTLPQIASLLISHLSPLTSRLVIHSIVTFSTSPAVHLRLGIHFSSRSLSLLPRGGSHHFNQARPCHLQAIRAPTVQRLLLGISIYNFLTTLSSLCFLLFVFPFLSFL